MLGLELDCLSGKRTESHYILRHEDWIESNNSGMDELKFCEIVYFLLKIGKRCVSMLEPIRKPADGKMLKQHLMNTGTFRKKDLDLSKWQRSSPPAYEYSYILNVIKLRELVSDYFVDEKTIKLIDVYELVLETNQMYRLIRHVKKTSKTLSEIENKSVLNATSTNEDSSNHQVSESGNDESTDRSTSTSNAIAEHENSNNIPNGGDSSSSSSSKSLAENRTTELSKLAEKCKHYPMRLDEHILTSSEKHAIVACVDVILESKVDLDPLVRKLIAMDTQHFAFNLLFPTKKRREKWNCRFDSSTSGWPFIRYPTK